MKKILLIAFLTLTSMSIQAQEELTWHTDMSKATDISIKENKPMFLFFTGSRLVWMVYPFAKGSI